MSSLKALAPAKLNLSLQVFRPDSSGLHPIRGLTLSIGRCDILTMESPGSDDLDIHGADLPEGQDNLVWKAVTELRRSLPTEHPRVRFDLRKRIPVAAGLAGGSSDAAAALVLYAHLVGFDRSGLDALALEVGADVGFCLRGGFRWIGGYGEQLEERLDVGEGFVLVVAVPPFPISTPRVYAAWDGLGEPRGPAYGGAYLPPAIRPHGPLANDLYPAAAAIAPELDDWRSELAHRWDRPGLMTGSGPSLFSFFSDQAEAEEALLLVPAEARSAFVAEPISHGVRLVNDGNQV